MTDNLRFKVNEILEYMQNEYLATAAKLDQIITLLGGAPPAPTATLEDVVNGIAATNQLLLGLQSNTAAMDQRLARLEAGLTLPIGSGIPNAQSSLNSANLYLSTIITLINAMPLDDQLAELQTLVSYLANIRSSVGLLPSAEATPIRDLLVDIRTCVCSEGIPPDEEPDEACTTSNGIVIHGYPVGGGVGIIVNVAIWDEPPTGTTFTTDYEIPATNAELTPDDTWEGWSIYVQSSAQYWMIAPGDGPFKATNQWIALGNDSAPIAPCVLRPDSITVTLCPPGEGGGEIEPCLTVASQSATVTPSYGYSPRQVAIFSTRNPQPSFTWPGGSATFDPPAAHYGDWGGSYVNYVSGRVRVVYGVSGSIINAGVLDAPGETLVLPEGTEYVAFGDETGTENEPGTGPFEVEWCLPVPA